MRIPCCAPLIDTVDQAWTPKSKRSLSTTPLFHQQSVSGALRNLAERSKKVEKQGYIFIPALGCDSVKSIVCIVAHRLINSKKPYSLILADEKQCEQFNRLLNHFKNNKLTKLDESDEWDTYLVQAFNYIKTHPPLNNAQKDSDSLLSQLSPATTKLYIDGHGQAEWMESFGSALKIRKS